MKAIILSQYEGPDGLKVGEVDKPQPTDTQVLVRIKAAAINDWDWGLVRRTPFYIRLLAGLFRPRVQIPGAEMSGVVEAVGKGVTRFQPDDAVYGDISECGFGGFAQYVCVPETALIRKPETMTFEEATAIPHAAALALQGLRDVGQLQPEGKLLINGAGGGVGTIGAQIARSMGAEDITGVDHGDKFAVMRQAGFGAVLDYTREDFTASGQRYDLILDTKTNRPPFRYLRVLKPGGAYVTVGGNTGRLLQIFFLGPLIRFFTGKRLSIVALKTNQDMDFLNSLYEKGGLKLFLEGPYPLVEVPGALSRFGAGKHLGKVIIRTD